jgi:hypothetical protein
MSMIPALSVATFGGAASALASFHPGTYGGSASGERVLFTTDTHTAHSFDWGGRPLFANAAIEHLHHYTADLKSPK